jgi:hypothetical protein
MLVAGSPALYADSPAFSHTRFKPKPMNCRSSLDKLVVAASKTATYTAGS